MSLNDYGLIYPNGPAHYGKTPDEAIVVPFAWASRLDGETISSTTYELPDGLTNAAEATPTNTIRTVRLTGGDDGGMYRVICKIVTSGTRTLEWVKRVKVCEG